MSDMIRRVLLQKWLGFHGIVVAATVLFAISVTSSYAMLPDDWASEKQKAIASKVAQAVAGSEMCNIDVDPEQLALTLRTNFGAYQTASMTADLMYMVTVAEATQASFIKSDQARKDWCEGLVAAFGPNGKDIKGLLTP